MTTPLSLSDRGKRLIAEVIQTALEYAEQPAGEWMPAYRRAEVAKRALSEYIAGLEHCGGTK